jgi:membrane protein
VIGLATALYVGLLWMQRLRAALSQMWGQQFPPPGFLNTKVSDVIALVAAFLASLLTIGLTALAVPVLIVPSIAVSWLLFTAMIARLPRQHVPFRRCVAAGLLAAVGFEVFKQVASVYLRIVLHGPAGAVFGPVLGVMVFAYMTARLILFATAWAALKSLN